MATSRNKHQPIRMASKKPSTALGRSLAFLQFQLRLTGEVQQFWYLTNATIYATRWLTALPPKEVPVTLGRFKGDHAYNFQSLDISPANFESLQDPARTRLRAAAVVTFVTAFEVYLLEAFKRALVVDPQTLDDSTMSFEASQVVGLLAEKAPGVAFAEAVTDRYMRGKTHREMIRKLDKVAEATVSVAKSSLIEEWSRWVLVRNTIVHLGAAVSEDLARGWPTRFATVASPLNLTDKEVASVHSLALRLAKAIDQRVVEGVIGERDSHLLAQEIYARIGTDDARSISESVSKLLGTRFSKSEAEAAIARQKRVGDTGGFQFSDQLARVLGEDPAAR